MNHQRMIRRHNTLKRAARAAIPVTVCAALLTQLGAEGADQPAPATAPTTQAMNHNATTQHNITTTPSGGLILNFKDAPITTVLDELSSAAGFIIVPVAKPTGRISVSSKQPLTPRDAVSLLNTLMKDAGFAAIQQGRVLKIVALADAKHSSIPVHIGSDPTKIEPTDELITQVIPLRQADAMQLKQDLAPLINPDADFTANQSSNSLIITDTAANIRRIVEIVNGLDSHLAESAEVRSFRLDYASATSAATLINELFQQTGTTAGGGGGGNPFQRFFGGGGRFGGGGGGFPGGGFRGGGNNGGGRSNQNAEAARSTVPVRAAADDRTNTLVVSGPTETLNSIADILKQLDANPAAEQSVFVYRLKNAQAVDVQATLNSLFNGTNTGGTNTRANLSSNNLGGQRAFGSGGLSSGAGRGGGGFGGGGGGGFGGGGGLGGGGGFGNNRNTGGGGFGGGGFGGGGFGGGLSNAAAQAASSLAGQVTIIADADTNSILIRTKAVNYDQVKPILDELDRPAGQVLIKVLIAEVTHNNSKDLGAEWSVLNLSAAGNGERIATGFALPTFNPDGSPSDKGLLARITGGDVNATIHLLQTVGKVDVLSRPYILASDNQLAEIVVGQEVPFVTNTQTTDTGNIINTVQYADVGLIVDVIPHINAEGLVIMDVAPEIDSQSDGSVTITKDVTAPIFNRRAAQSHVAIRDGQTVVIGGLMEDRINSTISKVPVLGDIPFIGEAFKRTQDQKTKTELLIFLTPHVALKPEYLKDMSESELRGTKLVPQAVYPGAFDEQKQGLERGGAPTTQPDDQK